MAALLVAMSVMAVLMGALLPQWTTLATREKEQELVFRGNQYARASACSSESSPIRHRRLSMCWWSNVFSARNTRIRSRTTIFS